VVSATANQESRNLDLLRTVAVLAVFLAHLILTLMPTHDVYDQVHSPAVELLYGLGEIGVLLFFVHTSLVLLLSLERIKTGRLFFTFYIRRFFRIYPLSTACIVTVIALRIPYVPELSYTPVGWREFLCNLFLIQNLTNVKEVVSPLWTLPWEVQMYVALPFIFVVLRRVGSIPLILLLWLGSLVAARTGLPLLSYVPCFMGGVLAYQIAKKKTMKLGGAFWLLVLLTSIAVFLFLRQRFRDAYLPECVFCLVIGAMVPQFKEFTASTFTQACHVIATYSYGIYLFHLPVIWFVFFKLKMWPVWAQWSALGGLMWLVPWAAYHYLESPLIQVGRNLTFGARSPERLAAEVS